jgi:hypothetical protein
LLPLQILEAGTVPIDPQLAAQARILEDNQLHHKGPVGTIFCLWKFGTNYHQLKELQSHAIEMKMAVRLPNMVDMVVAVEDTIVAEVVMIMVVVEVVAQLHQSIFKGKTNRLTCLK